MPFPFSLVCDLLEDSHRAALNPRLGPKAAIGAQRDLVASWFRRHRDRVDAPDADVAALLSTLLPEKRTDRVYCVGVTRLEKVVGRALMLGASRLAVLARYRQPGSSVDLGDCVEMILRETPNPTCAEKHALTVEDIDRLLHVLAARIKWSSPSVRAARSGPCSLSQPNCDSLAVLFRRLPARDAKWLVRVVLKDFQPVVLDPSLVYRCCDALLPPLLRIRDDFAPAISLLRSIRRDLSRRRPPMSTLEAKAALTTLARPRLGVKVGRQFWMKGRSIKHCLDMGAGRTMYVEKKMDGEYCQIHVDLSRGRTGNIQIFSKSGKDSTEDRSALAGVIRDSLELGRRSCKLSKGCILEGELVVYSDREHKVMPFDTIRKYVTRRGRFLGTECDSQKHPWEHLMIVYFDVLLIDDESLLAKPNSERFGRLRDLVSARDGFAELVERQVISFSHRSAASDLRRAFARTITARDEGLVLKPDEPYFSFGVGACGRNFNSCCIKLKKGYIGSFGDVGDFAVVAAGFDAAKARRYGIPGLKWTDFYLGCLTNKEAVSRWGARPEFTVVNVVEANPTQLRTIVAYCNPAAVAFSATEGDDIGLGLTIPHGVDNGRKPRFVFTNPPVFDLRCFSFERAGNTGFFSLRFPSVTKVHFDRSFCDTVSFDELQATAREATAMGPEGSVDSQELLRWIAALERADPRGVPVDALSQITTSTAATATPPPPAVLAPVASGGAIATTREAMAMQEKRPMTLQGGWCGGGARKRSADEAVVLPPTKRQRREFDTGTANCPIDLTSSLSSSAASFSQSEGPLEDPGPNFASSQHRVFPTASQQRDLPTQSKEGEEGGGGRGSPGTPTKRKTTKTAAAKSSSSSRSSSSSSSSSSPSLSPGRQHGPSVLGGDAAGINNKSCRYAGFRCHFSHREVLVAPSVTGASSHPAHALLVAHGVSTITDPDDWVRVSTTTTELASSSSSSLSPERHHQQQQQCQLEQHQQQQRGRRQQQRRRSGSGGGRKICLVDATSREAKGRAVKYMNVLAALPLCLSDGSKEIVAVYDWRVLESVRRLEDDECVDKRLDGFLDPWRQWLVGYV